jgi:osmoprotectant transport system ATP-binding protein
MPIELREVTKRYGDQTVVDRLTMTLADRTLTVLIGPSGCGKTTTMKMLNRLIERSSGEILFDGASIDSLDPIGLRRGIGYVIQEIGLFPHMTVYENITTVPKLLRWDKARIRSRVNELLELVNLPREYLGKYPDELSGGQRQRVGVARGLAADPAILLMDEPFGALDPINRERLQDSFLEIQKNIRKTVLFVTHDIREALKLADRLAIMDRGRLIQYDETIRVVHNPRNRFVEDLLGPDRTLKELEILRVADHYESAFIRITLTERTKIAEVLSAFGSDDAGRGQASVAFDSRGGLLGIVYAHELAAAEETADPRPLVHSVEPIGPYATLMEAITLMLTSGRTTLPVADEKKRVLGVIRFRKLFQALEQLSGTLTE